MMKQTSISTQENPNPIAAANVIAAVYKPLDDIGKKPLQRLPIQRKLSVGAPNDPLEHEADAVADKVMRMPEAGKIHPIHLSTETAIQKQDNETDAPTTPPKADDTKLKLQLTEPDFLSLRAPFLQRNVPHLWDPASAFGVWQFNLNFFKGIGLNNDWSGKAANLTTPFFINAQLKANNPTWWEITDRDLKTSSFVGSLPLFEFGADFKNWRPLPFLQKKANENASQQMLQRKCNHCEEEEKAQRKPLVPLIQKKENGNIGSTASDAVSNQINSTKGSGTTMDAQTQSFMESRFGTSFQNVKIHTGSYASELSQQLNAQAFTVGNHIYFNEGKYQPQSNAGKHLLAHELVHTVQQGGTIRRLPNQRPPFASIPIDYEMIQDPGERMEMMRRDYAVYQWKELLARFEKGEVDDKDLQNDRFRNRLTGLKTPEINSLITKIKAHQAQRDKDVKDPTVKDPDKKIPITTDKIIEWLEVRKVISTPMPDGAVVNKDPITQAIDSFTYKIKNIQITVIDDSFGAAGNETGPSSNFEGQFSWMKVGGKITQLKKDTVDFNPTQLEITIRTKYKENPNDQSGYGKGTTKSDHEEGTTTLRAHEGQHGTDFISYLSSTPLPFDINKGMNGNVTEVEFNKLLAYIKDITKATCEATDQIGFSQDEFLQTPDGQKSGIVSCRKRP